MLANLVLYFHRQQLWKLTDFGISRQVTSATVSTSLSRGTQGYRAPELLKEHAQFTRKVDVWAVGIIIYELVVGKRVFWDDWAVIDHYQSSASPISIPMQSLFWQHHTTENLLALLNKDWSQRPTASEISKMFSSYCEALHSSAAAVVSDSESYLLFAEWKKIAKYNLQASELLRQLGKAYERKGEDGVTAALWKAMVQWH